MLQSVCPAYDYTGSDMFHYDELKPWGRSFDEYLRMFALDETDLGKRILGCGDGPASFNQELTESGGRAVSVDPIYRFSATQIRDRIEASFQDVIDQTRNNQEQFVWTTIRSVEQLGRTRMASMQRFLEGYEEGLAVGRYVAAELPKLPFADRAFQLALCSHVLFLYSDLLDLEVHHASIVEMCRVAGEARIFPLLDYNARRSEHVHPVTRRLQEQGFEVSIERVAYEFQRGGNEMLRVVAPGDRPVRDAGGMRWSPAGGRPGSGQSADGRGQPTRGGGTGAHHRRRVPSAGRVAAETCDGAGRRVEKLGAEPSQCSIAIPGARLPGLDRGCVHAGAGDRRDFQPVARGPGAGRQGADPHRPPACSVSASAVAGGARPGFR